MSINPAFLIKAVIFLNTLDTNGDYYVDLEAHIKRKKM